MMEAADEVGFMLIPDSPDSGNGTSTYTRHTRQSYLDMVSLPQSPVGGALLPGQRGQRTRWFQPDWTAARHRRHPGSGCHLSFGFRASEGTVNGKMSGAKAGMPG